MKMFSRKVFMCIIITLEVIICQKDSDEGRPYEFGFTIDGQQHRHEKKDQNGIIQGEFGFITADGVYHVTVYATDENGDFKILSMRNIRISAPLDGSPALGPISPEASKYLKKANLPNQVEPAKPSIAIQKSEKLQEAPPPIRPTQKSIVTTQRAPYVFTTQSTIRPACGGCGLIAPAKPGTKFTFQNPAFKDNTTDVQNPQPNGKITGIQNRFSDIPSDTELLPPGYNNNIVPSSGKKLPQTFNPGFKSPVSNSQAQQSGGANADYSQVLNPTTMAANFDGPEQKFHPEFKIPVANSEFPQNKGYTTNTQVYNSNLAPAPGEKSSQTFDNINGSQQKFGPVQSGQFQQGSSIAGNTQSQNVKGPTGQSLSGPLNTISVSNNKPPSFGTVRASNGFTAQVDNKSPGGSQTFGGQQSGAVNGPDLSVESVAGKTDKLSRDRFGKLLAPSISSNGPNPLLRSQDIAKLPPVMVSDNVIHVMGKKPMDIPIKDKYPGMVDGLPNGVEVKDVTNILYKFKYTVGFHGHYEMGLKDGSKVGGYFVNGRDGISRVVTYVADENGFRPKFKFINLGLDSPDTPNEKTERTFGLKDFEFVWYPVQ